MEDNKKFCQTLITINSRDFPAAPIATTTTGADCWLVVGSTLLPGTRAMTVISTDKLKIRHN